MPSTKKEPKPVTADQGSDVPKDHTTNSKETKPMIANNQNSGNSNLLMLARITGKINFNRLTDVAVQWLFDLGQYRASVRLAASDSDEMMNTGELRQAEAESRRAFERETNSLLLDQLQTERRNAERLVARRTTLMRERIISRAGDKAQAESRKAVSEAKHSLSRVNMFTDIFTSRAIEETETKRDTIENRRKLIGFLRDFQQKTRRKYDYFERVKDLDEQSLKYDTDEKRAWVAVREFLLIHSVDDLFDFLRNSEGGDA